MLAGVLFFGFWLTTIGAFAGLDDHAARGDGQHVVDDRGRVTTVSPADRERQLDHEQQISLGVLGAVAVGGTFLTAAALTHRTAADEQHHPQAAAERSVSEAR